MKLAARLLAANLVHCGAAGRALALGGRLTVLHGDLLGIRHLLLRLAFHTVALHLVSHLLNRYSSAKTTAKLIFCARVPRLYIVFLLVRA